jgi:tetratricopeptide (TPR) repeat protein
VKRLSVVLAAMAFVCFAGTARADDEDDARAAMRRGVAAFGRGDANAALAEYEQAKKLAPNANAPYRYAAEALGALGRWPEAVTNLETYIAKNPSVSDAGEVRERIAKIKAEHYPARVRITANEADAVLKIDGETKGPVAAAPIELPPGKHRIEVTAPNKVAPAQDVVLVGDQDSSIAFALADEPPVKPTFEPPPIVVPPPPGPWKTIGWIGVGVGAATIVTMVIVAAAVLGPKIDD